MIRLIFNNTGLRPLLLFTQRAKKFLRGYGAAIAAYEAAGNTFEWAEVKIPEEFWYTDTPTLHLVKDQGVYLMTAAKDVGVPKDMSHVCYAHGYNPDVNKDDWYDKAHDVSGDDFVEDIEFTKELQEAVRGGAHILINWYGDSFEIITQLPK